MKFILVAAIIFGVTAFALDAFFAHGLRNFLGDAYSDSAAHSLTTASRYQIYASLYLLTMVIFYRHLPSMWILLSQGFAFLGVLFFCVSIYLKHIFGFATAGLVAPVGGIAFMLSLLALLPLTCSL